MSIQDANCFSPLVVPRCRSYFSNIERCSSSSFYSLKIGTGQQGRISGTYNCPQYKIKCRNIKYRELQKTQSQHSNSANTSSIVIAEQKLSKINMFNCLFKGSKRRCRLTYLGLPQRNSLAYVEVFLIHSWVSVRQLSWLHGLSRPLHLTRNKINGSCVIYFILCQMCGRPFFQNKIK